MGSEDKGRPNARPSDESIKDSYRTYFIEARKFINMPEIYKAAGIHQGNFSNFLKGRDASMKIENLEKMAERCSDIVFSLDKAGTLLRQELNKFNKGKA